MVRRWALAACVALTVSSFTSAGCSPSTGVPSTDAAREPGVTSLRGGRVQVVGTLVRSDLEGGLWKVTKSVPGPDAEGAETIAVLANGDALEDLSGLAGRYVLVRGTPLEGASIRMAGPEVAADSVEPATVP